MPVFDFERITLYKKLCKSNYLNISRIIIIVRKKFAFNFKFKFIIHSDCLWNVRKTTIMLR